MHAKFPIGAVIILTIAGAILPVSARADDPKAAEQTVNQDNLDEMLRTKAPELLKFLRSKNYANVGVLKFLVKKGDAPFSDNVGELNLSLANRLEVALVLSNPDEDLGIIQQASRTVSKENNVRANHLTKEGRKAFFSGDAGAYEYDLAWGSRKVTASAFVTGFVTIAKDLKKTELRFEVFDKEGNSSKVLDAVVMDTVPGTLTQAGYSYVLDPVRNKDAFVTAKKSKGNRFPTAVLVAASFDPLESQVGRLTPQEANVFKAAPIRLNVYYNGKLQAVTDGAVPEPKETDRVSFELENTTDDTWAVVLKVNGRNTLFDESYPDLMACHKWILEPKQKQVITGFQMTDKTTNEFKVLSPTESEANEVSYGEHAGTFHLACFRGKCVDQDPSVEKNKTRQPEEQALAAIGRGTLHGTDIKAGSLNALKESLRGRETEADGARGLIVQSGVEGEREVKRFFFAYDFASPVEEMTVRYYVPKKK